MSEAEAYDYWARLDERFKKHSWLSPTEFDLKKAQINREYSRVAQETLDCRENVMMCADCWESMWRKGCLNCRNKY